MDQQRFICFRGTLINLNNVFHIEVTVDASGEIVLKFTSTEGPSSNKQFICKSRESAEKSMKRLTDYMCNSGHYD